MVRALECDRLLGIEYYVCDEVYVGDSFYHVKSPQNFKVYEISLDNLIASLEECISCRESPIPSSRYAHFIMCKEGVDTLQAVRIVERVLNSRVSYAGLKDAESYSCQFISLKLRAGVEVSTYHDLGFIKLCLSRFSDYSIGRGYLLGNLFRVSLVPKSDLEGAYKLLYDKLTSNKVILIPNYYGHQRFGTKRPTTHLVGRSLIKKQWGNAVHLIAGKPLPSESVYVREAREEFERGNYEKALKLFPSNLWIERRVVNLMMKYNNPLRVLNSLSRDLISLYIEAYQAYLFNKALSKALNTFSSMGELLRVCETLVVPGWGLRLRVSDECMRFVYDAMEEEGVFSEDFKVNEINVVARSYVRDTYFSVSDVRFINNGDRIWIEFTLPRGSYASVFLRELLRGSLML